MGQGLAVLASPILTRLYTPQEFGEFAVFVAMLSVLASVASLRYELAIPLSAKDEAPGILWLSLYLLLFFGVGLFLLLRWFGEDLAVWVGAPGLVDYSWLLPLGVMLVGLYQTLSNWAIRLGDYKVVAQTKAQQGVGVVLAQVSLGFLGANTAGLLIGDTLGRSAGILRLWALRPRATGRLNFRELCRLGRRYSKFPSINAPSTLINRLGLQLPNLLLAGLYGPQVAGWYLLIQRVMGIPSSLVGQAVAQVYFGEASRLIRENPKALPSLFLNMTKRLLLFGALPMLLGGVLGSFFVSFIFGQDWAAAGRYLLVLTPMFAVQFVVSPLSQTLIVIGRQEYQLAWDVVRVVGVFLALWGTARFGMEALAAVTTLSGVSVASYVALMVLTVFALRQISERQVLGDRNEPR